MPGRNQQRRGPMSQQGDGGGPDPFSQALINRGPFPPLGQGPRPGRRYTHGYDYDYFSYGDLPAGDMGINEFNRQVAMTDSNQQEAENQMTTMQTERDLTAANQLATINNQHEERVGVQQQNHMQVLQQAQDLHIAGQRTYEATKHAQHEDALQALNEVKHARLLEHLAQIQAQTDRDAKAKAETDQRAMRMKVAYNDLRLAQQERSNQQRAQSQSQLKAIMEQTAAYAVQANTSNAVIMHNESERRTKLYAALQNHNAGLPVIDYGAVDHRALAMAGLGHLAPQPPADQSAHQQIPRHIAQAPPTPQRIAIAAGPAQQPGYWPYDDNEQAPPPPPGRRDQSADLYGRIAPAIQPRATPHAMPLQSDFSALSLQSTRDFDQQGYNAASTSMQAPQPRPPMSPLNIMSPPPTTTPIRLPAPVPLSNSSAPPDPDTASPEEMAAYLKEQGYTDEMLDAITAGPVP